MFPFAIPKKYTYPDGTQSTNRPSDGQVFYVWDANQNPVSTWQWDDLKEQWFNISSGKPTPQNTQTFVHHNIGGPFTLVLPASIDSIPINIDMGSIFPKCECGSESVGSPRHSSWCKKYDSSI